MSPLKSNTSDFFQELKKVHEEQSEVEYRLFVQKWTDKDCFFELVVRAIASRFEYDFLYKEKKIHNCQARKAIADIVRATCLKELIDYDEETGAMPWQKSVSNETKSAIENLMLEGNYSIMPSYDIETLRKADRTDGNKEKR